MRRRSRGFTLIELLIVLAIMASVFGLVAYNFAGHNTRRQSVQAAANELAATFRKARAMAMERKLPFGVVFNIQNDPASSGRVLNNRSGGHWYRIVGPGIPQVPACETQQGGPYTPYDVQQNMLAAWSEDAHVLPAGKVRFVALADMDWGNYRPASTGSTGSAASGARQKSATTSFPRPWFGWYDAAAKRLHGWGGYDPAIPSSGFYFWGNTESPAFAPVDPEPVSSATGLPPGCSNADERWMDRWMPIPTYPVQGRVPEAIKAHLLYAKGSPRPLVNGNWRDASLLFTSSGQVQWGDWMPARHVTAFKDSIWTGTGKPFRSGVSERSNRCETSVYSSTIPQYSCPEASCFDRDTGGWHITLGPDMATDEDSYPSAAKALDAIMPLFRVFVSSFGEVRVIAVGRREKSDGLSLFPASEDWWRTGTNTEVNFGYSRYRNAAGVVEGRPVTDFLTAGMLGNRSVWMK